MLRHLMKLIWKRKGRNIMLSLEILLAFIIVFAIAAFGLRNYQLYQSPLGYVHEDVWSVKLLPAQEGRAVFTSELYDKFKRGLEGLPEVKQVAFTSTSPYTNRTTRSDYKVPGSGLLLESEETEVSDDFFDILGVKLVAGRFFGQIDNGSAAQPTVINRRLARALFGTEAAVGMQFDASARDSKVKEMMVVTGVIDDFRKGGELAAPKNLAIVRNVPSPTGSNMELIVLKLAPGTTRAFEEKLSGQLRLIRNDWGYEIAPLSALRKTMFREQLTPLVILSVIAAFLLAMVAVGLFGVLWQNTTRRIPEIGLRRAIGANAGDIYRQIIAEQFLLSSGAIGVAMLLLVQLPITGALGEGLNWPVFAAATLVSMAVIYLLSLLCSVYPGWRASRLSPTEALHYE